MTRADVFLVAALIAAVIACAFAMLYFGERGRRKALESMMAFHGMMASRAPAYVQEPEPEPEQRIANAMPNFPDRTIEEGASHLMRLAREMGQELTHEEARAEAHRMLMEGSGLAT